MDKHPHKIFGRTECISEDVLLRYVNGQLSSKEKHVVEKHMLECELCADAAEGLMLMKDRSRFSPIVNELNRKIRERAADKPIILWMDTRVRVALAAGIALLIGLVFLFNYGLNKSAPEKTISDNSLTNKEAEHADTATGNTDTVKASGEKKALEETNDKDTKQQTSMQGPAPVTDNTTVTSGLESSQDENKKSVRSPQKDIPADERDQANGAGLSTASGKDATAGNEPEKQKKDEKKEVQTKENLGFIQGNENNQEIVTTSPPPKFSDDEQTVFKEKDESKKEEAPKKTTQQDGKKNKKKSPGGGNKPVTRSEGFVLNEKTSPAPSQTQHVTLGGTTGNYKDANLSLGDNDKTKTESDTTGLVLLDSVSSNTVNTKWENEGAMRYRNGEYNDAVKLLEQTLKTDPDNREALYYLGASYYELNKPDLAIQQFDKLITKGKGKYYDDALYGKSLALLKQGKKEEARKILDDIIRQGGPYKSKAIDAEKK